jgi:sarcosine oxidase
MSYEADVAVVGVGSMGSMALWRLAARGLRVHGYERFGIGHHRGAAGGQTRRFATLSQRDTRDTALALDALNMWRALERETGRELLTLTGGLIIAPADASELGTAEESARHHGLEYEHLDADALRHRFPPHPVEDGYAAVLDRLTGFVRPELSIVTAVRAARAHGAAVRDYCPVLSVEPDGDGVVVRTEDGDRHYRAAVIAPGAWAAQIVPVLGQRVVARRLIQSWYLPHDIEAYRADRFPVFERLGAVRAYGFPTLDGATIKVGVYTREHPVIDEPGSADLTISLDDVRLVRQDIARILPGLSPDPVTMSVHFEGYTPDGKPFIGPVPGMPGLFTACGFSGAGFKFAPAIGDLVADYVVDGGTDRDAAYLRPERVDESAQPAVPAVGAR